MTTDEQELLYITTVARDSGFRRVEVDPNDVIALLRRVEQLETRAEELRRRYEPTPAEWSEDADAQAGACWG